MRWLYYSKRTEGQNTIVVAHSNQLVTASPTVKNGSSGTLQSVGTTVFNVPDNSNAFFVADLGSAYGNVTSFQRGVRPFNKRRQVLLQDDIQASQSIQWRMHTNATFDPAGTVAMLDIGGKKMKAEIISPTSGATFGKADAVRYSDDPPIPDGQVDQPNPGVSVLTIDLPAGTYSLQVVFSPQWSGMSSNDFVNPPSVALSSWTLDSHN